MLPPLRRHRTSSPHAHPDYGQDVCFSIHIVCSLFSLLIIYIYTHILGLPTPKKYQSFCTIRRFMKFMVVSSVPQKVRRGMSWLCFPSAWPSSQSSHQYFAFNLHIQVGFCLIARSQNYTNLPDSWICGRLRVFCGRFADCCRRFAGNFGRSYVHLYALVLGYENGLVCPWDAARMQAMFSHIKNVTCGDNVATRKQNQAKQ